MSDHSDKEKDNQLDDKKYKDEKIEKEKAEYNQQLQAIELEMTDVQAKAKENIEALGGKTEVI